MKKRTILLPILVAAVLVAVVLAGRYYYSGLGVRHYDDGTIGVADLAKFDYDLERFAFRCSAVFTLDTGEDGQKQIQDIVAPFIQRYKGPNEYLFTPIQPEPEVTCLEEGTCYAIQQSFRAEKQGVYISDITVIAQITFDPATEDFTMDEEVLYA